MLAELTLLLHEMSDSLRSRTGRAPGTIAAPPSGTEDTRSAVVLVTGLPSPGTSRFVKRLHERLGPAGLTVLATGTRPSRDRPAILHVHVDTDLDGMVEGGAQSMTHNAAKGAQVVVPVDWEPVDRSVARVIHALANRGIGVGDAPGA